MAKDELRRHHLVTGQAMRTQRGPFGSRTHDVVIARGSPSIRRLAWREATGAAPEVSNHVGILVHIALPRPPHAHQHHGAHLRAGRRKVDQRIERLEINPFQPQSSPITSLVTPNPHFRRHNSHHGRKKLTLPTQ